MLDVRNKEKCFTSAYFIMRKCKGMSKMCKENRSKFVQPKKEIPKRGNGFLGLISGKFHDGMNFLPCSDVRGLKIAGFSDFLINSYELFIF